ncbi:MAG: hypothetical protein ABIF71_02400 [Planctomycetota bacterium]
MAAKPASWEEAVKRSQDPPAKRVKDDQASIAQGMTAGTITAKGPGWVEMVSPTGAKERYVADWKGGGPDPMVAKAIEGLVVGDRVAVA